MNVNESDLRSLPLCDDALPKERRDLIKARVMTSLLTAEGARQPKTAPGRFRRRLVFALVPAVLLLLMVGAAAAAGLIPHMTREQLDSTGIRGTNNLERLVASAQTDNGRRFQLWITSPAPDALPNGFALAEFDADGNEVGSTVAGGAPGGYDLTEMGDLWVGTPAQVSIAGMLISVMGHAPSPATAVEITLDDGTTVRADVQTDGYYLELVHGPGVDVGPGSEPHFPEAVHLKAIDKHGAVVEEMDLR